MFKPHRGVIFVEKIVENGIQLQRRGILLDNRYLLLDRQLLIDIIGILKLPLYHGVKNKYDFI
ncbi:hypothetical protein SAMN05878281_0490 [Salegentibacter salegens]|uniref:Uncharacterized protein n=1 Tax=Salegentibacter salegens TaxID=143223 RepID=A0A1M7IBH0_9FLAO|nr:hypothetical protein LY58_01366 [Salegentibacter salegens]SHM38156.1 hypothetical protein SAMN05878281_0490 [Salegentibacter salegens]